MKKSLVVIFLTSMLIISGCVPGYEYVPPEIVEPTQNVTERGVINETRPDDRDQNDFFVPIDKEKEFCEKNTCTLGIVIKDDTYSKLKQEINLYIKDVEKELNWKSEILTYPENIKAEKIKEDLKSLYFNKDLNGVLLVGAIPSFPMEYNLAGFKYSFSDILYADIYDNCKFKSVENPESSQDPNTATQGGDEEQYDIVYESGNSCLIGGDSIKVPFWISRLQPPVSGEDEIKLLKNYFNKNHNYRSDKYNYLKKLLLYYPMENQPQKEIDAALYGFRYSLISGGLPTYSSKSSQEPVKLNFDNSITYRDNEIVLLSDKEGDDVYISNLADGYEYVVYNGHGSPVFHENDIRSNLISKSKINFLYAKFLSCSVGRFTEKGYLAGWYLFGNPGSLVIDADTVPIFASLEANQNEILALLNGITFGESSLITGGNGVLLGDASLRMRYDLKDNEHRPKIAINKDSIDFGDLKSGSEKIYSMKIKNIGDRDLKIMLVNRIAYDYHSDYSKKIEIDLVGFPGNIIEDTKIVIKPNQILNYEISVTPISRATGDFSGIYYLFNNDPKNAVVKIPFKGKIT